MNWIIAAVVIVIVIVVVGVVAYQYMKPGSPGTSPSPTQTPTTPSPSSSGGPTTMTLYAGESGSNYGFGTSSNDIKSNPGPTLTFKVGQSYTVTLTNAGTMGHNWAIVDAKSSTANVLFSAQIGTGSTPVAAGASQSVTFTPTQTGSFYYICQVDAHVSLGMWGTVTVTS